MSDRMADDVPLGEARAWLRARLEEGAECPCCKQNAQVYLRSIHATMARDLVRFYRVTKGEWGHLSTVLNGKHPGDFAKLRYWKLIEEEPVVREDGGRAGWWRITPRGVDWIHERITVPQHARVYDRRCLKMEGPPMSIRDALGKKFDLRALLEGEA